MAREKVGSDKSNEDKPSAPLAKFQELQGLNNN
jgi:hypothetical protein